jgi:hypothetical protein
LVQENSATKPPDLPPRYYRDNFVSLCNSVEAQYADLLSGDELLFLHRFHALSVVAQCLYVRLVSRVGPWFRVSKLAYSEIGELEPVLEELIEQGLLFAPAELAPDEIGNLFTRAELVHAYGQQLPACSKMAKGELLCSIEAYESDGTLRLVRLIEVFDESIVAPDGALIVEVLEVLFFGNRRQGMTDFVLSDLGIARYFPYTLKPEHRLFVAREALDEYLSCSEAEHLFYEFIELEDEQGVIDIARFMIDREVSSPVAKTRWQRACNTLGRELERMGVLDLASELYQKSEIHPSRERHTRILEAKEDWPAVVAGCEDMLNDPRCEAEREAAQKIIVRAQRKLGLKMKPRTRDKFEQLKLNVKQSGHGVERDVAQYLSSEWKSVRYVENSLFNSLFGLAFWHEIFADVAGAFDHPFQSAPRDMYSSAFVANREKLLIARWALLKSSNLQGLLLSNFHDHIGYQCRWVDWHLLDEDLLLAVLRVIPPEHLFAIWERQLFDPGENRNGFPDLIALGEGMGDYCLIEVKAPGDALQNNQKRWLRYFQQHQIPASVAWVEWQGD